MKLSFTMHLVIVSCCFLLLAGVVKLAAMEGQAKQEQWRWDKACYLKQGEPMTDYEGARHCIKPNSTIEVVL